MVSLFDVNFILRSVVSLSWAAVKTGVPGLVVHRVRIPSSTDPNVSYRITAANGLPVGCTCACFHYADDDLIICQHLALAHSDPPVLS